MKKHFIALLLSTFVLTSSTYADCVKTVGATSRPCTVAEKSQRDQDIINFNVDKQASLASDALKQAQEILTVIYNQQPAQVRAQFYGLRSAVTDALNNGDIEAAKIIIQNAVVPAELEQIRTDMLNSFPE